MKKCARCGECEQINRYDDWKEKVCPKCWQITHSCVTCKATPPVYWTRPECPRCRWLRRRTVHGYRARADVATCTQSAFASTAEYEQHIAALAAKAEQRLPLKDAG